MTIPRFLPEERSYLPFYWLALSILMVIADYAAGPFIQFPVIYLIPVALASWYNGRSWGLTFAIALSLVRVFFNIAIWSVPWSIDDIIINGIIRITVFSLFAHIVDRNARQTRQLSRDVNMLSGLLPICSFCKKIRDESNHWHVVEQYISERSDVSFSHSLCPECRELNYGPPDRKAP